MNRFNYLIQLNHQLGKSRISFLCMILERIIRWYYHCDIPRQATIDGVYFCHKGFGTVIHPKAVIGQGTIIQHRVTIGEINEGVPYIGEKCYIGAGAIIIGNITIGNNSKIGAGAVVVSNIPANSTAVGIPAKVIVLEQS